ncbi:MAG: GNAT family N-acetyltransferase [Bacillus sp. (in: firmicutes)]
MPTKRITTVEELKKAFDIRKEVFIKEQLVPEQDEFDEYDTLGTADHILADLDGQVAGTARLRIVDGIGKLERVCLLKPFRKRGLGKALIAELEQIAKEKGFAEVKLHGQTHAENFYRKLGYETTSDVFMEDGIPHVVMKKKLF